MASPEPVAQVSFGAVNYAVLAAYLAVMVAVGIYFSRRERSTDDYFLAGRRVPWWAAGLSIFGGGLSALTYMAIPAKAFHGNWVFILTYIIPVLFIPVVVAFYIPFYRRLRVTTAYEYLEKRFNAATRMVASGYYVLFQFGRMTIMLYLPAVALSTVTGMNLYWCIVLMGILATVYTVLGGIEAVIWTDVLQVIVLTGAALLSLFMIAGKVDGGFGGIVVEGMKHGKFQTFVWTWDHTAAAIWVMVLGSFFSAIMPNTSDQSVVLRYLVTRDERAAKRAAWTSALLGIPTGFLFFFLGTALFVLYKVQHPQLLPADLNPHAILPLFVMQYMPPGISGLVVAGIFAAAMSTIDNGMNAVSTAVTTDFYRKIVPDATERKCLNAARVVTIAAGVIATVLAVILSRAEIKSVLDLFFDLLGLCGGGLAGLFILGMFTRRANGVGALVGALLSAAVLFNFKVFERCHFMLFAVIGLGVCVGAGYLTSLLLSSKRKDLTGLTVYSMPEEICEAETDASRRGDF